MTFCARALSEGLPAQAAPSLAMYGDQASLRASFMTDAMWFAWLLRPDVRQGASIGNQHAQREFVTWWLLHGAADYPGGWGVTPAVLAVAMEPVPLRPGFMLPRLLRGLYRLVSGAWRDGTGSGARIAARISGAYGSAQPAAHME